MVNLADHTIVIEHAHGYGGAVIVFIRVDDRPEPLVANLSIDAPVTCEAVIAGAIAFCQEYLDCEEAQGDAENDPPQVDLSSLMGMEI